MRFYNRAALMRGPVLVTDLCRKPMFLRQGRAARLL
jgi:hypothetical protein